MALLNADNIKEAAETANSLRECLRALAGTDSAEGFNVKSIVPGSEWLSTLHVTKADGARFTELRYAVRAVLASDALRYRQRLIELGYDPDTVKA